MTIPRRAKKKKGIGPSSITAVKMGMTFFVAMKTLFQSLRTLAVFGVYISLLYMSAGLYEARVDAM